MLNIYINKYFECNLLNGEISKLILDQIIF
jgi:hypothetical protein